MKKTREIIIKGDNFCQCTYNKEYGYVIRLLDYEYEKLSFAVTADGCVSIGNNKRPYIRLDDWNRLLQEINLGIEYMAKVSAFGIDPSEDRKNIEKIPVKDYKVGCYYRDRTNRGIMYFGRMIYTWRYGNLTQSPYGIMIMDSYNDLFDFLRLEDDEFGKVFGIRHRKNKFPHFDTRVSKPSNLIEELVHIPDFSGSVTIYMIWR